jgi:hypothetical protein
MEINMKLWILRPIDGVEEWESRYYKVFGHVIRADCETDARNIAAEYSGDEGKDAWLDTKKSTCIELTAEGDSECIMQDYEGA